MTECEICGPNGSPWKPQSREELLRKLVVGDIFHARAPNGASLVCLVTQISEDVIEARRIGPQQEVRFSRTSGLDLDDAASTIDSVAPLPKDIHDAFIGLDRRYRLWRDVADFKLTEDERKALLFIHDFYPANPV